jgi:glycosyltransferase involved in cell wall biosynthesis
MKRILIFYSHFSPAFKAGGPIQSLVNLVGNLNEEFKFFVVCSAFEMGETSVLPDIQVDQWNNYSKNVEVFYACAKKSSVIKKAIAYADPDHVYVNGMYVPFFNVLPIQFAKRKKINVIIAPRGMLQKGALGVKPFKKRIFLTAFKFLRLHKNVNWHATDQQESKDIKVLFGPGTLVKVAGNIPKAPATSLVPKIKKPGKLRLVYLSLITEKKNLHVALGALQRISLPVTFDIYGPIKDKSYWERCQTLLTGNVHTIQYQGIVTPENVQRTLLNYHALILPTKGENFSHAIYEALSVGTTPIISAHTPWGNLQDKNAGLTVYSEKEDEWAKAIAHFIHMDQNEFDTLSAGAYKLSRLYFSDNDFKSAYLELFN